MRIQIDQNPDLTETEIIIRCPMVDEDILRFVSMLRIQDQKITGSLDGEIHLLDARNVYYFESVDKRTLCHGLNAVYECPLRLYELEERLGCLDFLRISKAVIVNFNRIHSIQPDFGGRLILTLENGERQWVSRQYAPAFRQKLIPRERRRL